MLMRMRNVRAIIAETMSSPAAATASGLALYVHDVDGIVIYVLYDPRALLDVVREKGTDDVDLLTPVVNGYMIVAHRHDGTGWGAGEVMMSAAVHGYGPMLYDIAMGTEGGLMSDRNMVSVDAKRVWKYYKTNRDDVEAKPLDNVKRPKTPPRHDDARLHSGGADNPLNYAYFLSRSHGGQALIDKHARVWPVLKKVGVDDELFDDIGRAFFDKA